MNQENQLDLQRFSILMATLAEVFESNRELSKQKIEIYAYALADYSIDQISEAVKRIIKTRSFASFPKPAEIIEAIKAEDELIPICYLEYKGERIELTESKCQKDREEVRKIMEMLDRHNVNIRNIGNC